MTFKTQRLVAVSPVWVPNVDGVSEFTRNFLWLNRLFWFEWAAFYAARVLIASSVGSLCARKKEGGSH